MTPHESIVVVLEPPFIPSACDTLKDRQQALRFLAQAVSGLAQGYDLSARDDIRAALFVVENSYQQSRED